jgi:ABC-type multidrug transport system ATPase subunit
VLLLLDQPYPFRVGLFGSSKPANQLLINVDLRGEFLADLGLQVTSVEKPALATTTTQSQTHKETRVKRATHAGGNTLAIRTENLTRHYKEFIAVENLNLEVFAGEIYGFLGSNGAGKTTTMKMLVGLLQPDAGHAWIDSHDVWNEPLKAKAAFGYVADNTMLYDRLTGLEFLDFLAQIRDIPENESSGRIEQLLDVLELKDRAHTACGTYSFGMKRKLAIAGALIHKPAVLILDEPLNGLDPLSARRLKDLFAELAAGGTAILLSAPDLEEAFLSLTAEGEQVPV